MGGGGLASSRAHQTSNQPIARVLGRVALGGPDNEVRPRAGKHRVLFAGLLLQANQVVTVGDMVRWLWDASPPQTARQTLYVYLMRMRKELAAAVGDLASIDTVPGGYTLSIDPGLVDVMVFRKLVDQAHEAQLDGAPEQALELLREAEGLWRGTALTDVPSDRLQHDEVPGLVEEWSRTVERRIDVELALGRHDAVVGELRKLTTKFPLRERLWYLLMLALYQEGRQADALACYQQARELLVTEVGLEPGAELRELHRQILAGDAPAPPAQAAEQAGTGWVPQCQLPPDTMDFTGRVSETAQIVRVLTGADRQGVVPVVAVSGPPGAGKSTLAVHAAHALSAAFPDGQWYAHCGGGAEPRRAEDMIGDLLQLSGVRYRDIPDSLPARAALLRSRLAGRRVLLVIDDAAHVGQVLPLLPGTSDCAVLVTSRQLLAELPGVAHVRLEPLPRADAEKLLIALVGAVRAHGEPRAVADIVALCGGLPLALRIAGARLQARPGAGLHSFASALRDQTRRLDELEIGRLGVRAGIDLSYAALDPVARLAFRRLGLLGVGDFPAWVPAVLAGTPKTESLIETLVRASLVIEAGHDRTGEPRYRMHDLVGVYAAELAAEQENEDDLVALRRLLTALVQLSAAAWQRLRGNSWGWLHRDEAPVVELLDERLVTRLLCDELAWELAERRLVLVMVEKACRHGWYADAARLAAQFCVPTYREYQQMYGYVLAAATAAGDELTRWRAEFARARHFVHHQSGVALRRLSSCLRAFEKLGARRDAGQVLAWQALCHILADQPREARACAEGALAIAAETGGDDLQAMALPKLARALTMADRYDEAAGLFDEAWIEGRGSDDLGYRWAVLGRMSYLARREGDLDRARWAAEQGLAMASSGAEPAASGWMLCLLARVEIVRGDFERAEEHIARAAEFFRASDDLRGVAAADVVSGIIHLAQGRGDRAVHLLESALPVYRDSGEAVPTAEIEQLLLAARNGDSVLSHCVMR